MVCLGVSPDPKLDLDWATVYRRAGTDCGNCFRGCLLTELAGCSPLLAAALSSSSCGFSMWPPRVLAARQPASPAAKEPGDRGGHCDAVSVSALELTRHPFCCILHSSVLTSCRRGFHKCGSLGPCVGAATID